MASKKKRRRDRDEPLSAAAPQPEAADRGPAEPAAVSAPETPEPEAPEPDAAAPEAPPAAAAEPPRPAHMARPQPWWRPWVAPLERPASFLRHVHPRLVSERSLRPQQTLGLGLLALFLS